MSVRTKPSTQDSRLQAVFGAPVGALYERMLQADAPEALARALELRSFLALSEGHVARIRARIHQAMAPERDMHELDADDLRMDARWLEAALDARLSCHAALDELLRTMPQSEQQTHETPRVRRKVRATPALAHTEPESRQRAGPLRTSRP